MAEQEPFGYQKPPSSSKELDAKLDRVDELVNLLIDDAIEEDGFQELESLLEESVTARIQYVGLMQLHVDLMDHYNPRAVGGKSTPVLAHLTDTLNVAPTPPQPAD